VERLFDVSILPLCSPTLLEHQPLDQPMDLARHDLLHDDRESLYGNKPFWKSWLEGVGVEGMDPDRGAHFTHAFLAIAAAINGLGVVATTPVLVAEELEKRSLVAPLGRPLVMPTAYHIVGHARHEQREDIVAFRQWLHEQAAATMATVEKALR